MFPGFTKVVLFASLIVSCLGGPTGPVDATIAEPEHSVKTTEPPNPSSCSEQDLDICTTKDCTLTAAMLIAAMDTSVEPCDDFYSFTCANYIRTHPVPEDELTVTTFQGFNRDFDLQLKNLVEGLGSLKGANAIYRAQELYHVCINTTYQKDKELEAFRNYTRDILDWPMASGSDWQPQKPTLNELIIAYEIAGLNNAFLNMMVTPQHDVTISSIRLNDLAGIHYLREGSPLIDYMKGLLHLLGVDDDEAIDKDIEDMKQVGKQETTTTVSPDDDASSGDENASESHRTLLANTEHRVTITFEQLYELTDNNFDWLGIINASMKNMVILDKHDNVTIDNPLKFRTSYAEINRLPQRTVHNIMAWNAVMSLTYMKVLKQASHEIEELEVKTIPKKTLTEKPQPRWKKCLELLDHMFPLVTSRLFIEKYIDRDGKASADELIQLIQQAYIKSLRESDWLDEDTKNKAILKAEMMTRHVAYPDFIFDEQKLDEYYQNTLPEIRSTLFENNMEFYRDTDSAKRLANVLDVKQHDFEEWIMDLLKINAGYSWEDNSMWFPIGILQLPFFHNRRLAALNFGMIGAVIGHEIGHAFDVTGSKYDESGKRLDWWTEATKEEYQKRSQCFIDQYNNFCPEELQGDKNAVCVNGRYTLGENQADLTGLSAAFEAYRLWVEKHGAEKRLPGLHEYTPEQLLFIAYGHIWCENISPDKWLPRYYRDQHAPQEYRVLGSLSNSLFFRETFQCPVGRMNRGNDSCAMW